jgi:hypothetical protein
MRYVPYEEDERKPYRAPEMAGPPVEKPMDDDVIKQPGTMGALFLVIALLVGIGIVIAGLYGPSRNFQEPVALLTMGGE